MGTSASSKGPGSNVPLVPPWVDNPPSEPSQDGQQPPVQSLPPPLLAQPRRFAGARRNLGAFASSGNQEYLKSALGHYTRSGLGGSAAATRRMGSTVQTLGKAYSVFDSLRSGAPTPEWFRLDLGTLSGMSANAAVNALAAAICPLDGSQDSEVNQSALSVALTDLAAAYPDKDFTALSNEQIVTLADRMMGEALCQRADLDIGRSILDKAPNHIIGVHRLNEMKDYIQSRVTAEFANRFRGQAVLTHRDFTLLSEEVMRDVFSFFEEYVT